MSTNFKTPDCVTVEPMADDDCGDATMATPETADYWSVYARFEDGAKRWESDHGYLREAQWFAQRIARDIDVHVAKAS